MFQQRLFHLHRNEHGAVTVFAVMMFAMLIAFGGLVFDVGRIFNLFSQSQSYVDRVALAAAAELDGRGGSIERAIRAAMGDGVRAAILNPGDRMTLSDDQVVNVRKLTFLSAIAADPAPGTRSPVAGDIALCTFEEGALDCGDLTQAEADAQAEYVLVDATTETEQFFLFPLAAWLAPDISTQASVAPQALAGFTRQVCNVPPMMICNPYENPNPPYGGDFTPTLGQQILLKSQGTSSASWVPGDFGLLHVPSDAGGAACSGGGANFLRCVLAVLDPNTRCISTTVDVRPGEANTINVGLNVRFDIYDSPFQSNAGNPAFAPSANVTKGKIHGVNQCRSNQLNPPPAGSMTVRLPRDSCFTAGTCSRFGNGITGADLQGYWTVNHGGTLPAGLVTRYDVYRYEIENGVIPNKSSTGGENGAPSVTSGCAPSGVADETRDRRVFTVAVVNCKEHNVRGSVDNIPVVAFAKMFMTEPVGLDGSSVNDVWVEMIGVIDPGADDGILHEFPVLYR